MQEIDISRWLFELPARQPIQPIWKQFFALCWSALKKPSWELNFLNIFAVPLSSMHEKCSQILERLFVVFPLPRNILCLRCCWNFNNSTAVASRLFKIKTSSHSVGLFNVNIGVFTSRGRGSMDVVL